VGITSYDTLHELFQHVADVAPCPMLIIDATDDPQQIVYANPAFTRLSGCGPEELTGIGWTSLFSASDAKSSVEDFHAALRSGNDAQAVLCARHKSGAPLWLDVRSSPLRSGDDLPTHHLAVIHDLTEERRARAELEYRAYHDALTGLANRYLLEDRFEQIAAHARRHGGFVVVALIDMNDFKLVNDHLGHAAGDEVLKCLAARLAASVRAEDTVARLGGDEFVLLLQEIEGLDRTAQVMARVTESLARPIPVQGHEVALTGCTGVSRFPADGTTLDALLSKADWALYKAKGALPDAQGRWLRLIPLKR
jgi:diguanylate cyclase (GGDEF)-like protein/PAS domain S-box-containing protein